MRTGHPESSTRTQAQHDELRAWDRVPGAPAGGEVGEVRGGSCKGFSKSCR